MKLIYKLMFIYFGNDLILEMLNSTSIRIGSKQYLKIVLASVI